ncbi:prephenate dehydratase domain-containing protein [Streptomyces sp. NPDC093595]|uniref:prephenate dehydratase domain-containing protein n=1 Tax=Streptomyces sp. NPDC093595 TaxID=3366045 RepID=UPI0037FAD56E
MNEDALLTMSDSRPSLTRYLNRRLECTRPKKSKPLSDSVRYAFLGPEGTFTHEALLTLPEAASRVLLPAQTVSAALKWVSRNEVYAAMVPLHNSIAGPVAETVDYLHSDPWLKISRIVRVRIVFSLLTRSNCAVREIRTIAGHPHSLPQTRDWMATHLPHVKWCPVASNADAARRVAAGEFDAALGGECTARRWDLHTLVREISNREPAVTTFTLVTAPHWSA